MFALLSCRVLITSGCPIATAGSDKDFEASYSNFWLGIVPVQS